MRLLYNIEKGEIMKTLNLIDTAKNVLDIGMIMFYGCIGKSYNVIVKCTI